MKLYSICISPNELGYARSKQKGRDIDNFELTSPATKEHTNIDPPTFPVGNGCTGTAPGPQHNIKEASQKIATCTRTSPHATTTRRKPVLGIRAKIFQNSHIERRNQSAFVIEECGNKGTVEECFFEGATKFKRGSFARRTVRKAVHPFNKKVAVGV